KLTEQAVAAFRDKAQTTARLFGYGSYTIRSVQVGEVGTVTPMPRMYAKAAMAAEAAPVPMEGGKAQVTVSVNGSVQMLK
ncbi:SIMPL domain-containing protein, partial [Acinetobacter baumannii]